MNRSKRFSVVTCALSLALVIALTGGCKKKRPPITTDIQQPPPIANQNTGSGLPSIDITTIFDEDTSLARVYFDFDSYALRKDALDALKQNAEKMKQTTGALYRVEGHCDERGTQEYNIALGERRALAVRDHLIKLGVPGDRLLTISYGKESPAADGLGHNEASWAKNRRCQFGKGIPKK